MKYDDLLINYLGEFGKYQKIQYFLVCLPAAMTAMQVLSWSFTGADIPHRCAYPGEPSDSCFKLPFSLFNVDKSDEKRYNEFVCKKPDGVSWSTMTSLYVSGMSRNNGTLNNSTTEQLCPGFIPNNTSTENDVPVGELNFFDSNLRDCEGKYRWDHSEITNSAMSRWTITCDRSYLKAVVQSMYYIGQAGGSLVFGMISDRIGRKKAFLLAILMQCIAALLMAFVPWVEVFIILRAIVGFGHPGIFIVSVVIGMELVGPSKRWIGGIVTGVFFGLGQVILGGLAYAIRDYQYLQLAITLPYLLFLSYWWLVPESARWLITRGRNEEADMVLQRAAKINGTSLPDRWYEQLDSEPKKVADRKYTILDLFRTPNIRRRTLICFYCWPVVSGVYYGISVNPGMYGGNRYVTFILAGAAEIPGILLSGFLVNRLGRKTLILAGYSITAACMLITLAIPKNQTGWLTLFVVLAKAAITMTYALMYVFTPELFPTVIRGTATGLCSMMARAGAVASSYAALVLVKHSREAVMIIFGVFSLTAGLLIMLLPETSGAKQAETIQDVEECGKDRNVFSCRRPAPEAQSYNSDPGEEFALKEPLEDGENGGVVA